MSLVLKVACPSCGWHQDSPIGTEVRCDRCGHDFRALGHGESCTRIVSVTPDELDNVPYSQRSTEVPRSTASALVISDPSLLDDKLLRDLPLKDSAHFCGRVRLIKKLGQGGMGAVYRGFDESLALDVAVKILPIPPGGVEMHFTDRFRMEARLSAQINHANVVRTRDVGEAGGLVYLVMDFVEGMTARQLLERKGVIPVPQALQIVHDATQGMQAAHERGIVHRDIKPENILVAEDGRVMLADLGLAKATGARGTSTLAPITQMGLLLGTPEYMSPEQWDIGAHISPRSDIWSMGITLWVLLTRRAPFEDQDIGMLAKKIKEAPLPDIHALRPDVPQKVAQILYACLAKNPQRRFMNAAALASALHQAMMHPDQADEESGQTGSSLYIPTRHEVYQPSQPPVLIQPPAPPALPAARQQAAQPAAPRTRGSEAPVQKLPLRAKSDTRIRRGGSRSRSRKLILVSIPAAAACVFLAVNHYGSVKLFKDGDTQLAAKTTTLEAAKPTAPAFTAELDVTVPQRVKPGEKVFLSAALKNIADADKYHIVWRTGPAGKESQQDGAEITAQIDADKEYEVRALDPMTNKPVARKVVKVETELQVSASEVMNPEDLNAPTRLEGVVRGGGGAEQTEVRWVDKANPSVALCTKPVFEPDLKDQPAGVKIYICQARRKGAKEWAASDKAWVTVKPTLPADYTLALNDGERLMKEADAAETGALATTALKQAQKSFERAEKAHQAGDAAKRTVDCLKALRREAEYARLITDAQQLSYEAEKIANVDLTKKFEALLSALKPLYEAQVLFKRPEVVNEIKRLETKATECKGAITAVEGSDRLRKAFDERIAVARSAVKDAEKYQKLSDALPHWEKALAAFKEIAKQYPKRVEDYELDFKKVQEWHDKAYLFTTMGFIPAKPDDPILKQQNPRSKATPPPAKSSTAPTPTAKD